MALAELLTDTDAEPRLAGVVAEVADGPAGTTLVVRTGHGRRSIRLRARPDVAMARSIVAGLRRVRWVRIGTGAGASAVHAELVALTHRRPVRRRIPLAAALALAADGVPTVVSWHGEV